MNEPVNWDNRKRCRNCRGCRYLGKAGAVYACDYIGHTGMKRPCPPGKLCTVKEKKRTVR